MRLIKVLDKVNQIEKSSFLKLLDGFCADCRKLEPQVDKILSQSEGELKKVDNESIVELFNLVRSSYLRNLKNSIKYSDHQLDIIVDIFVRDGNCVMSREWFFKLYNTEIEKLKSNIRKFSSELNKEKNKSTIDAQRKRDYKIYQSCVRTAYENDLEINRDKNLSWEEKTICNTLSKCLELSNEETKLITYTVIPLKKYNSEDLIAELRESGIVFYNRRTNTIFIPDEIVWLLREILSIDIPDKYLRRILRHLKDSEINRVSRKYNIDRKLSRNKKINDIIKQGISATNLLVGDIFLDKTSKQDRVNRIQTLITKELELTLPRYGRSLDDKVSILILYYKELDWDETSSLTQDGYNKLLTDLKKFFPELNKMIKNEFELQPDNVMSAEVLSDYNVQPRDILYLKPKEKLREFCKSYGIKSRGHLVSNIINKYRDIEDLFIENFELVGCRDLNSLKEKGLAVKESELSTLYEKLTKKIFEKLNFDVDEKLRRKLGTKRLQMDIILNLGNKNIIIIDCKSTKDKDYNKYTSVSRQLSSYEKHCHNKGYNVSQLIIVANDFSEDFTSECEYEYEFSLSLITSRGLVKILEGFKNSNLNEFPVRLFMKDGKLNADRVVSALNR